MIAPTKITVTIPTPTRALVLDPWTLERVLEERRRSGADRWDEVWDGVLHVVPNPSAEHQSIVHKLAVALDGVFAGSDAVVLHEMNTVDPSRGLTNFRIPDIVVLLPGSRGVLKRTFVSGGPDFAVEVRSPNDETYEKIPFYATHGVRELLVVEPDSKRVELYRHDGRDLVRVPGSPVASEVVGLAFETVEREGKPTLLVTARDGRSWEIRPLSIVDDP